MAIKNKIYYRGLNLDRAGEKRKDPEWLQQQWQHDQCRVLMVHRDRNLMIWNRESQLAPVAISHSRGEAEAVLPEFEDLVFLGFDENTPLFSADVSVVEESNILALPGDHDFVDLREAGWLLNGQEAALLAYARGLLYWNRHNRFCSNCGSVADSRQGGHLRQCSNSECGRLHFPRTDPAVIMLVEDRSGAGKPRCLLGRNARFPGRLLSTLAGFVDPSESLEECVAREVFEEAGVRVNNIRYQASQPWPFPSSIMLGFRAQAVTTEIEVDGVEIAEAHWFDVDQLNGFGEWGDSGDGYILPRRDSIARYLIDSWRQDVSD